MTGDEIRTISIDRYPDPACSYVFEQQQPVVQAHNNEFESVCGLSTGDILSEQLENGLSTVDELPSFEDDAEFQIKTGDETQYRVRVIPPDGDEFGHLLFNETDGCTLNGLGVDSVASVISHDLRNPLDVAQARLRAGRELDSPEHFDHVEQAHDRMERIIQDVLTLARGEDVVNPDEKVELGSVARDAWQTVETNGATLDIDEALPTVVADRDRVSRLFENFFRNSLEHGLDQSVEDATITVTIGRLEDGFYVADDGVGIPEAKRERVFEPGFTADEHGTGLGLAIVARIVDLHGWSIEVTESAEGGARFEVTAVESDGET